MVTGKIIEEESRTRLKQRSHKAKTSKNKGKHRKMIFSAVHRLAIHSTAAHCTKELSLERTVVTSFQPPSVTIFACTYVVMEGCVTLW